MKELRVLCYKPWRVIYLVNDPSCPNQQCIENSLE